MMEPTDQHPQTLLRVTAKIALAAVLLGVIRAAANSSGADLIWAPDAFFMGAFLGLIQVSSDYHRLPASRRLPPLPTLAVGLVSMVVVVLALRSAPRPLADLDWLGWLAVLAMAGAPLYLLVAGAVNLRRGRPATP
jgi:hypothetical protein